MSTEIDHVFLCCAVGAPEAEELRRLGLREGPPNIHPGQGTACRRFMFDNVYLELLWVCDEQDAQSDAVRPTRLWERWRDRDAAACPFGLVLREGTGEAGQPPFPITEYRPSYVPPGVAIGIARDTVLSEPAVFLLASGGGGRRGGQRVLHDIPVSKLTGVTVFGPLRAPLTPAVAAVQASGVAAIQESDDYRMELEFNRGRRGELADLRPTLPLVLRW